MNLGTPSRPWSLTVVALLMILFGLAEAATGFRRSFFGVATKSGAVSTSAGATIGAFYAAAGALVLTKRKWAAALAIGFLAADVVGRMAMVRAGLYPLDSPIQIIAIVVGTAIVIAFAIYIASKWRVFN
jgi:hypothetical protein